MVLGQDRANSGNFRQAPIPGFIISSGGRREGEGTPPGGISPTTFRQRRYHSGNPGGTHTATSSRSTSGSAHRDRNLGFPSLWRQDFPDENDRDGSIAIGRGGYMAARNEAEHYANEHQREVREPDNEGLPAIASRAGPSLRWHSLGVHRAGTGRVAVKGNF